MIRGTSHHAVREIESFFGLLKANHNLGQVTLQHIDFTKVDINWKALDVSRATFLGCKLTDSDQLLLLSQGAMIFPNTEKLPYKPYRAKLYTYQELNSPSPLDPARTIDLDIYEHFAQDRFSPSINEALFQRIHDHAIDDALRDFLRPRAHNTYEARCVGIMGGHGTLRSDPMYREVAHTAQLLAQAGYMVVSGGGPGTMEAANLGAYMARYSASDLDRAIDAILPYEHYTHPQFTSEAIAVLQSFPDATQSLAIPTWFYGHEPSNVFATHIAKYFSNSIREDNLLAICLHGIIFAPGSAGTTQEIFQDAAQNHYVTYDYISPMVFLGKQRYEIDTPLYATLQQLAQGRDYQQYLFLTDGAQEAVDAIINHPPIQSK